MGRPPGQWRQPTTALSWLPSAPESLPAFKAMKTPKEAESRRAQAEAGFRQLGATSLLERLMQDLGD